MSRICVVQIQPGKHVLLIDRASYTAPARPHELDHTYHTDHTDQESSCLGRTRTSTVLSAISPVRGTIPLANQQRQRFYFFISSCSSRRPLTPPTHPARPPFFLILAADPVLTTYILLWGSIREPFLKKMLGDNDYLLSFTKGFSELPSPAQVPSVGAAFLFVPFCALRY